MRSKSELKLATLCLLSNNNVELQKYRKRYYLDLGVVVLGNYQLNVRHSLSENKITIIINKAIPPETIRSHRVKPLAIFIKFNKWISINFKQLGGKTCQRKIRKDLG